MNISQQNIDDLNATITLTVQKEDYAATVENQLKIKQKTATTAGFRKGKVPMGLIRKQFAMTLQMDEINALVSQKLQRYLSEADFKVLGEPLPSEKQTTIDFDNSEEFDFLFDIAITPEVTIDLSDKDSIVKYDIDVEEGAVDKQILQYRSQYAEMVNPDVAEARDMIKGNAVAEGVSKEGAIVMAERIEDATVKAALIGAKVGAVIEFNPLQVMGADDAAAFLGLDKDAVVDGNVAFSVTEITRYVDAELNEELFKKVYPAGDVLSEEDFRKRIEADVKGNMTVESDARFEWDARAYVIEQLKDVKFPEAFLKRWITATNQGKEDFDAEKLDAEFPKVLDDLRWQLATNEIAVKAELKIEAEEPMNTAKKMAAQQFAMYGMANLPEEYYEDYAKKMLEDQAQMETIITRTMTDKVVAYIKENVTLKSEAISMDDFKKLYEQA